MRRFLLSFIIFIWVLAGLLVADVRAQGYVPPVLDGVEKVASSASEAGVAVVVKTKKAVPDLTQIKSKTRLEKVLDGQTVDSVWPFNFLKVAIRSAVDQGVAANTIVLLLMFPLVAALVAFSRNVIGIKGFGIFTPAVVSVAFLATGIVAGLILFVAIVLAATLGRVWVRSWVRLPYLPRMAVIIWMVSMATLFLLLISPQLSLSALVSLGIFPVLLFVLLAETFIDVQIHRTTRAAIFMVVETLILAVIAYFMMSFSWLQRLVLLNPEWSVLGILVLDFIIGRYSGLRVLELWRFRELLKD